jgi:hypothetical protein
MFHRFYAQAIILSAIIKTVTLFVMEAGYREMREATLSRHTVAEAPHR